MVVSAVVEFLAGDNTRMAIGIVLVGAALYWRKALRLGGLLSSWGGRVVFAAGVIGIGLVSGAVQIDLAQLMAYAEQVIELGGELLPDVQEVLGA